MSQSDPFFQINGFPQDTERVDKAICQAMTQQTFENEEELLEKTKDFELLEIKDESEFLQYYLKAIKRNWAIDINDFTIPSKPGFLGKLELTIKKVIWKALKFYTFRLFSQQREFNHQVAHAIIALHQDGSNQIKALSEKLDQLKKQANS